MLVCFAIPEEARPFHKLIGARNGLEVLVTGMGRHNTECALEAALARGMPSCVLTCGFAGGLDPSLQLNDILCETSDENLVRRLQAHGARPVRFHCADRMMVTAEEKAALHRQTGADAVEMESRWIQERCRSSGLSCATVRVVSDTANETMLLDFNTLTTADLKMNYAKLLLALLRAPGRLPALLKLQRQTQAAARTLAAFLQRVMAD
jgi:adenosylhomocysteine nucleosidase